MTDVNEAPISINHKRIFVGSSVVIPKSGHHLSRSELSIGMVTNIDKNYITVDGDRTRIARSGSRRFIYVI